MSLWVRVGPTFTLGVWRCGHMNARPEGRAYTCAVAAMLGAFDRHFAGQPRNGSVVLKVIPDGHGVSGRFGATLHPAARR